MDNILISLFIGIIVVLSFAFSENIMRGLSLDPNRERDISGFNGVLTLFVSIWLVVSEGSMRKNLMFFLFGGAISIPLSIIYIRNKFKNIQNNLLTLYSKKTIIPFFVICIIAMVWFGYKGYAHESILFLLGLLLPHAIILFVFSKRFEKDHGILYLKRFDKK
jgi:hypothetical protein